MNEAKQHLSRHKDNELLNLNIIGTTRPVTVSAANGGLPIFWGVPHDFRAPFCQSPGRRIKAPANMDNAGTPTNATRTFFSRLAPAAFSNGGFNYSLSPWIGLCLPRQTHLEMCLSLVFLVLIPIPWRA